MDTPPLEGMKIVDAHEMARIEGLACSQGASEQAFMEHAGAAIAEIVQEFLEDRHLSKTVTLLVGKGNNGGDAYAAGIKLIERGVKTKALHIYSLDTCGPLCKTMYDKFRSIGGEIFHVHNESAFHFQSDGIILDGLVGTGFRGKADGILSTAIEKANQSGLPIIAIDIPSGLNGSTGEVGTVAIHAAQTIFLGLPKIGFFLKNGWEHVGTLKYASFGLQEKYIAEAKASALPFK